MPLTINYEWFNKVTTKENSTETSLSTIRINGNEDYLQKLFTEVS
jgi:hypothetical protein